MWINNWQYSISILSIMPEEIFLVTSVNSTVVLIAFAAVFSCIYYSSPSLPPFLTQIFSLSLFIHGLPFSQLLFYSECWTFEPLFKCFPLLLHLISCQYLISYFTFHVFFSAAFHSVALVFVTSLSITSLEDVITDEELLVAADQEDSWLQRFNWCWFLFSNLSEHGFHSWMKPKKMLATHMWSSKIR